MSHNESCMVVLLKGLLFQASGAASIVLNQEVLPAGSWFNLQ